MKLEEIVRQGQTYLAQLDVVHNSNLDPAFRIEVGQRTLRAHSDAMKGMDIIQLEAIVAACIGAAKYHERRAPDGGHLGEAVRALEEAAASLRLNGLEEEAAMEHEAPYDRLSGEQLGLRPL